MSRTFHWQTAHLRSGKPRFSRQRGLYRLGLLALTRTPWRTSEDEENSQGEGGEDEQDSSSDSSPQQETH